MADEIAPTYAGNSSNTTTPLTNEFVEINITWTETGGVAQAWFGNNFTGTWINDTPRTYTSGIDIGKRSKVIPLNGRIICWGSDANRQIPYAPETIRCFQ